jgi:hypothetical protein
MEVDGCGEIGTRLENRNDQAGIFVLEVEFGGRRVRTVLVLPRI